MLLLKIPSSKFNYRLICKHLHLYLSFGNRLISKTLYLIVLTRMYLFLLSFTEMGLSYPLVIILVLFGGFFLISFFITSPNMDTKGLLRVLYSKPVRKADGSVEYPESRNN